MTQNKFQLYCILFCIYSYYAEYITMLYKTTCYNRYHFSGDNIVLFILTSSF